MIPGLSFRPGYILVFTNGVALGKFNSLSFGFLVYKTEALWPDSQGFYKDLIGEAINKIPEQTPGKHHVCYYYCWYNEPFALVNTSVSFITKHNQTVQISNFQKVPSLILSVAKSLCPTNIHFCWAKHEALGTQK